MHVLFNISALIKLAVVFVFIIVLIRQKLSLGTALVAASILLGLWFRLSAWQIGTSIVDSLIAERTVYSLLWSL